MESYAPAEVGPGAREVLREYLADPLLVDALLLPICYYGSSREDDVDWYQFVVLFKSLFFEGFARPEGGIRTLLAALVARLKESGAELRLNTGVEEVLVRDGVARGVRLEDGGELTCDRLLSSAGYVETLRLCGAPQAARLTPEDEGRLSFVETVSIQDRPPAERGHAAAVVFFNDAERFEYRRPESLVEVTSGVICSPNNYAAAEPLEEGVVRVTVLANPAGWEALDVEEYAEQKDRASELALGAAARWIPDPRPFELDRDSFTPRTIRRFTGHVNGAVYGSPTKHLDGESGVERLYLCGTDQGLLGVVGALLSGITIANRHALAATPSP
jgi:phytoene dehydrogenase-like protein